MIKTIRFDALTIGDVFTCDTLQVGSEYRKLSATVAALSDLATKDGDLVGGKIHLKKSALVKIDVPDPPPPTPEELARRNHLSIQYTIESMLSNADADLAKFATRLAENPFYAFEWSEDAFKAAARKDVGVRMLALLNDTEHGGADVVRQYALQETVRGSQYGYHSTSAASNLVHTYRLAAYAELVKF